MAIVYNNRCAIERLVIEKKKQMIDPLRRLDTVQFLSDLQNYAKFVDTNKMRRIDIVTLMERYRSSLHIRKEKNQGNEIGSDCHFFKTYSWNEMSVVT